VLFHYPPNIIVCIYNYYRFGFLFNWPSFFRVTPGYAWFPKENLLWYLRQEGYPFCHSDNSSNALQ